MKGLVFPGGREVAFIDVPDPTPETGEVVLEVKASGMCGSDLHPYRASPNADIPLEKRFIAGHEPCGVVVAVGEGVASQVAKIGDRVMVHHYHGCTTCAHCRTGWPQLCRPATRTTYSANAHGAHAPYMKVAAATLVRLDDRLSFEAGAAIACGTGTAWGGLQRLQLRGEETIAVFGQGPVGLSATLLASAMGARVIAIDRDPHRLALAESFGAHSTIDASTTDVAQMLRDLTHGEGIPAVLETSGATQAASAGLAATAIWGRLCLVGIGATLQMETKALLDRQITAMTSYTMSLVGQSDCAKFIVERKLDVDRLFTHRWKLEYAEEAYQLFDSQATGKGVFVF